MSSWQNLQDRSHGPDHQYESASPHLLHVNLRNQIAIAIQHAVERSLARSGQCRVLEIGAGHGAFTEFAVAAGAMVTVTEMSESSAEVLARRFRRNNRVRVVYDRDGESMICERATYDVVLCISVLHHIPDYLAYTADLVGLVSPGGDLISFQDPLWYPRRSRRSMAAQWGAYFAWRVFQGDLRRGLRTRVRHFRGILDERLVEDMVEYHVVRRGVDELALQTLLVRSFASVELVKYWSTQSAVLHRLGQRLRLQSNFGLVAARRHAD